MAGIPGRPLRNGEGNLVRVSDEGVRREGAFLQRRRRGGPLLRMDRRQGGHARRNASAAALYAAEEGQPVFAAERRAPDLAGGARPDPSEGPGGRPARHPGSV